MMVIMMIESWLSLSGKTVYHDHVVDRIDDFDNHQWKHFLTDDFEDNEQGYNFHDNSHDNCQNNCHENSHHISHNDSHNICHNNSHNNNPDNCQGEHADCRGRSLTEVPANTEGRIIKSL